MKCCFLKKLVLLCTLLLQVTAAGVTCPHLKDFAVLAPADFAHDLVVVLIAPLLMKHKQGVSCCVLSC